MPSLGLGATRSTLRQLEKPQDLTPHLVAGLRAILPRADLHRLAAVARALEGAGACHHCGVLFTTEPDIECLCRTATYCSTACLRSDQGRHARDCHVIQAVMKTARRRLRMTCCVCMTDVVCSARCKASTGIICQNGHCVCRECYAQLPHDTQVVVSAQSGLAMRCRRCPLCRCTMLAESGSTRVFVDMTRVMNGDSPCRYAVAEILVRWSMMKPSHCIDALQNEVMRQVSQPLSVQLQSGALVLENGGGAYAVYVQRLHERSAEGPLLANTSGVICDIANHPDAVRCAALHGAGSAKVQYGGTLLLDDNHASHCQAHVLFNSAMDKGELTATIYLAVAAMMRPNLAKAFYLLSRVHRLRWVASAHYYGNRVLMLLSNLAQRFGRWSYCIECIAMCPPAMWSWWVVGACLWRMARVEERSMKPEHAEEYRLAKDLFRQMRQKTRRPGGTHRTAICVPTLMQGAMMAWAHGAKSCDRCAFAAARVTSLNERNWAGLSGREPVPLLYLRRAARLGNGRAMAELGHVLLYHPFVPPRPQEAHRWLQNAADKGNKRAATLLSRVPLEGARRCSAAGCSGSGRYVLPGGFSRRQLEKRWCQARCRNCVESGGKSVQQPVRAKCERRGAKADCIILV